MQNYKGTLLQATAQMDDEIFKKTTIFIIDHNSNGITGFIINKLFHRRFNELVEFQNSPALPLWYGGPVQEEGLFFLHRCSHLISDAQMVANEIFYSGNFADALQHINSGAITQNDIKLLTGYCGWDANELENEIENGYWQIMEGDSSTIFNSL